MTDRKLYQRLGINAADIRAALECFRPIADRREIGVDVAFSRTLWIVAGCRWSSLISYSMSVLRLGGRLPWSWPRSKILVRPLAG